MTKQAKTFRSVMCGVVAFLLCVSLTLLFLCVSVKATALNPDYAIEIVESSDYAELMQKELKEEFISYGNACNVNESFFDTLFTDVLSVKQIDADTEINLNTFYGVKTDSNSDDQLKAKFLESLEVYAQGEGYNIDDSMVENLSVMAEEMLGLYNAYVGMFTASYFTTASSVLARYSPYVGYAIIGFAVFSVVAAAIIRLSFKKRKNYLRFYIYSTAGATLMLSVGPAVALIMRIGSRINVANASLYGFASGFINYIFVGILVAALIMAVITASLVFVRNRAVEANK